MSVMERHFQMPVLTQSQPPILHRLRIRRWLDRHNEQSRPVFAQHFHEAQLFRNGHVESQTTYWGIHRVRSEHMTIHGNAKLARIVLKEFSCAAPALCEKRTADLCLVSLPPPAR